MIFLFCNIAYDFCLKCHVHVGVACVQSELDPLSVGDIAWLAPIWSWADPHELVGLHKDLGSMALGQDDPNAHVSSV